MVAIIGLVSAIALPAYQSYVRTAKMTKLSQSFDLGVRLARHEFSKQSARMAFGISSSVPTSDSGWIALMDQENSTLAGDGSAMYRPGIPPGGDSSGAVFVNWDVASSQLIIRHSEFLDLTGREARITTSTFQLIDN